MSIARHHAEWLSLVEVSGPFLAMRVLERVFPQGLDDHPAALRQRLAQAHEEWLDNQECLRPDPAIHRQWVKHVLREVLGYEEQDLAAGQALPPALSVTLAQHHETLRPTFAILEPADRPRAGTARLVVELVNPGQSLEEIVPNKPWKASPATRMATLLQSSGTRLGLLTNGRHFMLVHAAPNETTSFVSFYSHLFFEEPITLRAFQSLLSMRRLFGVADADTLEALFADSSKDQFEVTDQLGLQVRRAVQILIQTIDRIDRDRQRTLLQGLNEETLYHAAVTVMMRLVFLLAAEERNLLLLGHELYDAHYAVSTLRDQLQEVADKQGEEVLERRYAAWSRLLATFRAVHGGVTHEDLRLPAYGGSLFDPDRFPFLEGRTAGASWKDTSSAGIPPLPIDDRTVLHLLRSLQLLEMKVGTGLYETRRLSFRALGVEAIGNVYEGLLDHTAKRAKGPVLALQGGIEVEVEVLENVKTSTREKVAEYIANMTGRAAKTVQKNIEYKIPREDERHWLVACDNVLDVYKRVEPWAGLVRKEAERPAVVPPGSVYVTAGTERRATGTHYTPPSLTEPIVKHTLEPLVYVGPAEGLPEAEWKLRSPREILMLKVCDLAMGSGAFLVQACRYLSERLVEAWEAAEKQAGGKLVLTPEGNLSQGDPAERMLPIDENERKAFAKRYVADRCLYGVDKNPMAVEMAKLSLWLETLQKDRPFTFIDHALKSGDSLLGLTSAEQIERFHLHPALGKTMPLGGHVAKDALALARKKREELESFAVDTVEDTHRKTNLLREADAATADARLVADVIIGAALSTATKGEKALEKRLSELGPLVADYVGKPTDERRADLQKRAVEMLNEGRGPKHPERKPFHWVIEFPEVFVGHGGFDAFVGNPPFMGGRLISGAYGSTYLDWLTSGIDVSAGQADIAAYFVLRAHHCVRPSGFLGLVTTNTIAQGDTARVGLGHLIDSGALIYNAESSLVWPGGASVHISKFWVCNGNYSGAILLDGRNVTHINSLLKTDGGALERQELEANGGIASKGFDIGGAGFLLDENEYYTFFQAHPEERNVIRPHINGKEVYERADLKPDRYIINFNDWTLEEASRYPHALERLRRLVKPYRDTVNRKSTRENWWIYNEDRPGLRRAVSRLERVLVKVLTSNTWAFAFLPSQWSFDQALIVFAMDGYDDFCVLQSRIHEAWAKWTPSTMKSDSRYTIASCFTTFPLIGATTNRTQLNESGKTYYEFRAALMVKNNEGLTKTYNRFHNPEERSPDILQLRELHAQMDRAVLDAYGWTEIRPEYDFRKQLDDSIRYTWSEDTRDEVLGKLLELNQQRYAEEVAAGLHDKTKTKKEKADKPAAPTQTVPIAQTGFNFDAPARLSTPAIAPAPAHTPADAVLAFLRTAIGPVGKNDIVQRAGIDEKAFKGIIDDLKAKGMIEQVGEKRGAKYQVTAEGRKGG